MTMGVDQLHTSGITLKLQISPKPLIPPVSAGRKCGASNTKCSVPSLAMALKVHAVGHFRHVENMPQPRESRPQKIQNPEDSSGRLTKLLCINQKKIYL